MIKILLAFTDALIFYSIIIQLENKNRIKKSIKIHILHVKLLNTVL